MIGPQSIVPPDETGPARRLFIAITCPLVQPVAQALEELRLLAAESAGQLKVVNKNTLHITLKFLGSTRDAKLAELCRTLDELARTCDPFPIELAGTGCFPGVLWLGVRNNPALSALAGKIEHSMQALGFDAETRSFHPHVTVTRIKSRADPLALQWHQRFFSSEWGSVPVTAITLYCSVTTPQGAKYSALHRAKLRGN